MRSSGSGILSINGICAPAVAFHSKCVHFRYGGMHGKINSRIGSQEVLRGSALGYPPDVILPPALFLFPRILSRIVLTRAAGHTPQQPRLLPSVLADAQAGACDT